MQCHERHIEIAKLNGVDMKKILVATDGSDHAERAVQLAADIAGKYDSELVLVNVNDGHTLSEAESHLAEVEYGEEIRRRVGKRMEEVRGFGKLGMQGVMRQDTDLAPAIREVLGEQILERAKEAAKATGVENVRTVLKEGDPGEKIIEAANEEGANLIVLGSRGLGDVRALLLGSVSHKVANRSDINVITVK